jgi:hypothetical protein
MLVRRPGILDQRCGLLVTLANGFERGFFEIGIPLLPRAIFVPPVSYESISV